MDGSAADAAQPGYSLLAVSDPSADATATQTWTVLDDAQQTGEWTARAGQPDPVPGPQTGLASTGPGSTSLDQAGFDTGTGPLRATRGPVDTATADQDAVGSAGQAAVAAAPSAFAAPGAFPDTGAEPDADWPPRPSPDPADSGWFSRPDLDSAAPPADGPRTAGPGGPPAGAPPRRSRSAARGRKPRKPRKPASRARMWLMPVAMMVIAAALVAGAYRHFVKDRGTASSAASPASRPSSTASSPAPSLGPWKHITSRADDPVPLTLTELFPDHFSHGSTVAARAIQQAAKNCTKMVLGQALQTALRKAGCTQVMRASYLSTGQQIMATIGVLNLDNVTSAEKAGKATGATAFIKQLPAAKGPTKNLVKGTGLEEAQFKGHYLILTWAEFTNLKVPAGAAQRAKLDAFSRNLVAGTANISLTSRELFGKTQTP